MPVRTDSEMVCINCGSLFFRSDCGSLPVRDDVSNLVTGTEYRCPFCGSDNLKESEDD